MKRILSLLLIIASACGAAFAQAPGSRPFPATGLDTPATLFEVRDKATTKLDASASSIATTLTVESTALFPSSGSLLLNKQEIAFYTHKTSRSFLGLLRGREGTAAIGLAKGAIVEQTQIAAHHNTVALQLVEAQKKIGYGATTPFLNAILKGTGSGSSAWALPLLDDSNDVVITSPSTNQVLMYDGVRWVNGTVAGIGTVTSVAGSAGGIFGFTGGPVTGAGTLTLGVTGTSGGIPYFSSGSVLSSSGALAANRLVLGGGAGASPTALAFGTGNQLVGMNNGATGNEYKNLAFGTSGSDLGIVHSANLITFNVPNASATTRGVLSNTDWSTFNSKIGAFSTVNDTNVTISYASNTLTTGWSGALSKVRQHTQTAYKDENNLFAAKQNFLTTGKAVESLANPLVNTLLGSTGENDYQFFGYQRGAAGDAAATGVPHFNWQIHQKPNAGAMETVFNLFFGAFRHGSGAVPTANGGAEAVYHGGFWIESDATVTTLAGMHDIVGLFSGAEALAGSTARAYSGHDDTRLSSTSGAGVGREIVVRNLTGVDSPPIQSGSEAGRTIGLNLVARGTGKNGVAIFGQSGNGANSAFQTFLSLEAGAVASGGYILDFNASGATPASPMRIANAAYLTSRNAANLQDIATLGVNASNQVQLAPNGDTTAIGGSIVVTGTGRRFQADMSNATNSANRFSFQTSTTNGNTVIAAITNGTGNISIFRAFAGSDPDNSPFAGLFATSTAVGVESNKLGAGVAQSFAVRMSGTDIIYIGPNKIMSFYGSGGNVASAGTIVPTGNSFTITGTTTISNIDTSHAQPGCQLTLITQSAGLVFDEAGNLDITNATSLTSTANGLIFAVWDGSKWRVR